MTIRLVLAEDNNLVREGVRQLIETHQPDVVVTDIRMLPTGTDEGVRLLYLSEAKA